MTSTSLDGVPRATELPSGVGFATLLSDELQQLELTVRRLAKVIEAPPNRPYQIIAGKRSFTADTALRLGRHLSTSAAFWMNLQSMYELDVARPGSAEVLRRIPERVDRSTSSPG